MVYQVSLTRPAARQLATAQAWWLANRLENPTLLRNEISVLITSLAAFPDRGVAEQRANPRSRIRYLVTPRTRYVVRYRVRPRALRVEVLSIEYGGRAS